MRGAVFVESQSSARGNQAPFKEEQGASGPLDFLYETRWQAVRASRCCQSLRLCCFDSLMCCYTLEHQRILEDSHSILTDFSEVLWLCNMVRYGVAIKQVLIGQLCGVVDVGNRDLADED